MPGCEWLCWARLDLAPSERLKTQLAAFAETGAPLHGAGAAATSDPAAGFGNMMTAGRWEHALSRDFKGAAPEIYRNLRSQGVSSVRDWCDRTYKGGRTADVDGLVAFGTRSRLHARPYQVRHQALSSPFSFLSPLSFPPLPSSPPPSPASSSLRLRWTCLSSSSQDRRSSPLSLLPPFHQLSRALFIGPCFPFFSPSFHSPAPFETCLLHACACATRVRKIFPPFWSHLSR